MLVLRRAGIAQEAGQSYRIGFPGVASASASVTMRRFDAFRTGMRALGCVEGSNLTIDIRWAEGDADRLAELARDLIRLRVDVLVTVGSTSTCAAKAATPTIPIVMLAVGDAVGTGLVARSAVPWPFSLVPAKPRIVARSRRSKALGFKPLSVRIMGVASIG